jgi:hypothetical protein
MSRIPRGCLKALYPESCHTAPFDVAQNGTTESIDPRLRFEHSTGGLQVRNYHKKYYPPQSSASTAEPLAGRTEVRYFFAALFLSVF